MNENLAVILMLLFMLAVLASVWNGVASRQRARERSRVFTHAIGVIAGSGALLGAFCLSGAILLPASPEYSSVPVGVLGALILLAYAAFLYRARKQTRAALLLAGPAVPVSTAPAQLADSPSFSRRTLGQRFREWRKMAREKQESGWNEFVRETRRSMRAEGLGMPFEDFVRARFEPHLRFWLLVSFLVFWGILFFQVPQQDGWLADLVLSFTTALILALIYGIACIFILPAIPLLLVLLPLVGLSLLAEAEWRLRFDRPCIEVIRANDSAAATARASRAPADPFPWLLPLLVGVLVGSAWGCDEE